MFGRKLPPPPGQPNPGGPPQRPPPPTNYPGPGGATNEAPQSSNAPPRQVLNRPVMPARPPPVASQNYQSQPPQYQSQPPQYQSQPPQRMPPTMPPARAAPQPQPVVAAQIAMPEEIECEEIECEEIEVEEVRPVAIGVPMSVGGGAVARPVALPSRANAPNVSAPPKPKRFVAGVDPSLHLKTILTTNNIPEEYESDQIVFILELAESLGANEADILSSVPFNPETDGRPIVKEEEPEPEVAAEPVYEEPQEGDMFFYAPPPKAKPKPEDDALQSDLDRMLASLDGLSGF